MTLLLNFDNYSVAAREQHILIDVSLDIRAGEKIAIVGPSGAGKSTLLMEIYRRLGNDAALCPQQLGLVDALSAYHNIYMAQLERRAFVLNLWNLLFPLKKEMHEIEQLSEPLGLVPLLGKPVVGLSGGERQRVALARACYRQKSIFIGDEPVSSLDPEQGQQLLAQVCARHETAIVALHSPTLALVNFDRVIGLRGGALSFNRPAAELSADFLTAFYRGA